MILKGLGVPEDQMEWCNGVMGVPITFLDKYSPDQFEILNCNDYRRCGFNKIKPHGLVKDQDSAINGKPTYVRVLIKSK